MPRSVLILPVINSTVFLYCCSCIFYSAKKKRSGIIFNNLIHYTTNFHFVLNILPYKCQNIVSCSFILFLTKQYKRNHRLHLIIQVHVNSNILCDEMTFAVFCCQCCLICCFCLFCNNYCHRRCNIFILIGYCIVCSTRKADMPLLFRSQLQKMHWHPHLIPNYLQ